jgi:hypothetical protein
MVAKPRPCPGVIRNRQTFKGERLAINDFRLFIIQTAIVKEVAGD